MVPIIYIYVAIRILAVISRLFTVECRLYEFGWVFIIILFIIRFIIIYFSLIKASCL